MQKPLDQRIFQSDRINLPFIVIRHGQSQYTNEEDTGGDIVEGMLSKEGKITIQQSISEIIQQLQKYSIHDLKIFSSPKKRCLQTSEIVQNYLKKTSVTFSFQIAPMLRDVQVIGPQNNLSNSYTRWEENMLPGENWYSSWMRKAKEGMKFFPGEESPKDVQKRVENFIQTILPLHKSTLLICHEEILGAIAEIFELKWEQPTYGEVWYIFPRNI